MSLFLRRCVMNAFFSPENQKNQNSTFCVFEHFFNFGIFLKTSGAASKTMNWKLYGLFRMKMTAGSVLRVCTEEGLKSCSYSALSR